MKFRGKSARRGTRGLGGALFIAHTGLACRLAHIFGSVLVWDFSVQPLCSLCLCGSLAEKITTEAQRTQRLHREEIQLKTPPHIRRNMVRLAPARSISGKLRLPGDKSISHRVALIAALASGSSEIFNFSTACDCASTLGCLRDLGISIEQKGDKLVFAGGQKLTK